MGMILDDPPGRQIGDSDGDGGGPPIPGESGMGMGADPDPRQIGDRGSTGMDPPGRLWACAAEQLHLMGSRMSPLWHA